MVHIREYPPGVIRWVYTGKQPATKHELDDIITCDATKGQNRRKLF